MTAENDKEDSAVAGPRKRLVLITAPSPPAVPRGFHYGGQTTYTPSTCPPLSAQPRTLNADPRSVYRAAMGEGIGWPAFFIVEPTHHRITGASASLCPAYTCLRIYVCGRTRDGDAGALTGRARRGRKTCSTCHLTDAQARNEVLTRGNSLQWGFGPRNTFVRSPISQL